MGRTMRSWFSPAGYNNTRRPLLSFMSDLLSSMPATASTQGDASEHDCECYHRLRLSAVMERAGQGRTQV